MKCVLLSGPTAAERIELTDCPVPKVQPGWVLVKVRAFGLNHSEQVLRLDEISYDYIPKPIIPGIECVGEIADPSDSAFHKGQKVVALMGGMGRSFNGSYAEYALLPADHVFAADTGLSWAELAAVPETWFTAWGSLFEGLQLEAIDTLLIRGATCALGYAAMQIAKAAGATVIATTHREEKLPLLEGADQAVLDTGTLQGSLAGVSKVLELIGAKTLRDSLQIPERGGIVCHTGILGGVYGLNQFDPIKEIPNGVYLTGFFSNYPTQETMDSIFRFQSDHAVEPRIGAIYDFDDIRQALVDIDNHRTDGKIVVVVDSDGQEAPECC